MRLTTKRRTAFISSINALMILSLVFGILAFVFNYKAKLLPHNYLFLVFSGLVALIYFMRGKEYFDYDSDGEALNFKNYSPIPFWSKKSDEFPKYKLKEFSIADAFLYKKLYIKIDSKKGKDIILRYDISYLNTNEIKDLYRSLSKVVKKNKAQKS
ncbi:hypothetical protein [Bergeyella zoohelcum]|uniref:Uncharacterized protein n=1 Tax=Bergeyella zoohelcum TaxID=1015 RepID=A0A376C354_9FLAO|nr:hypothetical protein [Bergeyella zoohelcum]EKB58492.1 hypothetical protein HMPREF9700_01944 [Bergeyella zoohelcum CCUG 30536]SSZ55925.1 Uncharacterised protein [Bergeyella zoohelcum]